MPNSIAIEMKNISFSYGKKSILTGFDLKIKRGQLVCLVGSSGSGKTTTLRLINGLLTPQSGQVFIQGQPFDFAQSEKNRRFMGYSIQGSGLFPHMTLKENLTIIARKEKWQQSKVDERVEELCQLMSLPCDNTFLNKKPREISGGQQQRVGIARALFMRPEIMLMDEPFSALDPITRSELQNEFLSLQKKLQLTIVIVTHDLAEAFRMADEVVLLNHGAIEQKGRPSHFLLSPATDYVANFIGSHSPGHRLKEIHLYSVVNTKILATQMADHNFVLHNLDSGEKINLSSKKEAEDFLSQHGQNQHYWVDAGLTFQYAENFQGDKFSKSLASTQNILVGMKELLLAKNNSLPVINEAGQLVGVFSEGALDAL